MHISSVILPCLNAVAEVTESGVNTMYFEAMILLQFAITTSLALKTAMGIREVKFTSKLISKLMTLAISLVYIAFTSFVLIILITESFDTAVVSDIAVVSQLPFGMLVVIALVATLIYSSLATLFLHGVMKALSPDTFGSETFVAKVIQVAAFSSIVWTLIVICSIVDLENTSITTIRSILSTPIVYPHRTAI